MREKRDGVKKEDLLKYKIMEAKEETV